ncbi:putative transmembrane protein [Heterostelium album PN500]|uniref:Putative transmembrane protein n=1 Tax=Heterostelium pallidum (strain ATCC 26659 / Pp 5 / PN500) TaxID=670386 RepID=D3AZR3_HETP5|nr:putative transmembrane protein [Heterostelium album PN500]EFA84537.1 putative transmembrane protein [Heterostelium album PN500]|eukprot:XP_020436650.1 putative transmembrane protein [Heterostelium album PN500]
MGFCSKVGLVILAIIFPPLAALICVGCSGHFWLNVLLTILGWIPGVIHALYLVLSGKHHNHHS